MGGSPPVHIAVVGSGPAGCFAAQHLRKKWGSARITVFDRNPVPFGLLRYGVAPDHQGTKAVTRQFDRMFRDGDVKFAGNVAVGEDVSLADLREAFDVVVLATGLTGDRSLDVPGRTLPGVYGSGKVTRTFNDHPAETHPIDFGERIAVVGNGNVAIDIVRLLVKNEDGFVGSDLHPQNLAWLRERPVRRIDVIGRSPVETAKFDPVMVRELAKLTHVEFGVADPAVFTQHPGDARTEALEYLVSQPKSAEPEATVMFHFGWAPIEIAGQGRVEKIRLQGVDPERPPLTLECDSVITAIGFECRRGVDVSIPDVQEWVCPEGSGRIGEGLYCAGWLNQGGRGAVPDIRSAAKNVADLIVADAGVGRIRSGAPGIESLPADVLDRMTDFAGWERIDKAEIAAAGECRAREKIRDRKALLMLAAHAGLVGSKTSRKAHIEQSSPNLEACR